MFLKKDLLSMQWPEQEEEKAGKEIAGVNQLCRLCQGVNNTD